MHINEFSTELYELELTGMGTASHETTSEFADWRFNLRMSNTEPVVRMNVETRANPALMEQKRDELLALHTAGLQPHKKKRAKVEPLKDAMNPAPAPAPTDPAPTAETSTPPTPRRKRKKPPEV